jgi:TolB-like protein/DNA-binding winged helix-turn-helix (wHTH) protein/Tfp pilus assembly protein PilF
MMGNKASVFRFSDVEVREREFSLLKAGKVLAVEPKAFRVLLLLLRNPQKLISKEELLNAVWGDTAVTEGSLTRSIWLLRRLLGDDINEPRYIETVATVGYRLVCKVEVSESTDKASGLSEADVVEKPADRPSLGRWSRTRIMATVLALAATIGALIVGAKLYFARPAKRIGSIAVLPLENLSRNPDQEYFADGMTEELTTDLAKIGGLRVISRTSSMQYKGTKKSLPEIGRELNVDAVLEGSVLRAGDRVRITVQLIRASTDEHIWEETFDRDLKDVLPLQGEVARTIASQIKVTLSPEEQSRLTPRPAVNSKAHEDYLKGLYYLHRNTEGDLRTAIEYFQHTTEQDPNYASGFAGLASAYANLSSTYRAPREVMPQAKAAALRALELDQNLAEAHAWLGFVSINFDWDAVTAEKELKRATELNPSYADAHAIYAWYLSGMGLHEQAIAEAKRAMQLDPFSRFTYGDQSWVLLMARRYDQALLESQTVVERQPDFGYARAVLGLSYAENGRYAEAVKEAQSATRLDDSPLMLTLLVQVHALARNRSEAMKVLQDMEQLTEKRYVCSYEVATAYVLLREKDQAFRWFDKAVEERSDCMVALAVDPRLDSLRSDQRFQDLQRRVGLWRP